MKMELGQIMHALWQRLNPLELLDELLLLRCIAHGFVS